MAITKVKVTDGFLTLWVNPESNTISIRRNNRRPLDEIDYRADDLYNYYKHLMADPADVSPELEKFFQQEDYFDGSIITITVYTCGHYRVHYRKLKKSKRFFPWKKFF